MERMNCFDRLARYKAELAAAAPPQDGLWYRPGEDGYRLCSLVRLAETECAAEAPAMVEALRAFLSDNRADNDGNTVAFLVPVAQYESARAILARIDGEGATPIEAPEAPTVEIQPEPELGRFVLHDYRTLAGGLMEMIDGGRLSAADMPDDFEWLESKLLYLAAHDKGAEQRETLAEVRRRYSMQGEG